MRIIRVRISEKPFQKFVYVFGSSFNLFSKSIMCSIIRAVSSLSLFFRVTLGVVLAPISSSGNELTIWRTVYAGIRWTVATHRGGSRGDQSDHATKVKIGQKNRKLLNYNSSPVVKLRAV